MTTSKKWICIEKFLPEKFDVDYNEKVKKAIDYIRERREFLLYEGKNPEQSYIFLSPVSDEDGLGSVVNDFNVGKFLVLLKRTGVIDNLYLPIFIRETQNKEVIEIKSLTPVWFSPESAVMEALEAPKEFRNKIPRFQIKNWNKFLEIEKQFKESKNKEEIAKYPIRKTALQNVAVEIKELTSHSGLEDFFSDFNIPKELYGEGSKYDKVFAVLSKVNQETLFRIIEEAVHPLRFFGGDEERALQMQDLFSSFLQYDGYCIHDGKVVKATPETLKRIKARIGKRKEKQTNQASDSKEIVPTKEPFPIRIVGETEIKGLEKGLEKIAKTKKEEDKNKFPYKLPAGTVWENIIFQFLNDENVFIKVGQHKHYTNYKEIGLVGKGKNPKPSELWTFLKVLALENGEIPIDNLKRETKYKKQKELLSKFLQSYFGINLDPFYPYKPYPPYKHEKSYKIRMTLIPPPQSAKKQNDFNKEDKNDLGMKEYYKQQTPEIYDKDQ